MTTLTWLDRLRIERAVWSLDTRVAALPGRSRRTIRREIRANLRAASVDVGTSRAVAHLGDLRRLANGYLDAEYGDGRPRVRYLKAFFWTMAAELLVIVAMFAGHDSFLAGLEAGRVSPDGVYAWQQLDWLGITGDVTYRQGELDSFGFSLSTWTLLYLFAAFALGGRLWRLLPGWRSRKSVTSM